MSPGTVRQTPVQVPGGEQYFCQALAIVTEPTKPTFSWALTIPMIYQTPLLQVPLLGVLSIESHVVAIISFTIHPLEQLCHSVRDTTYTFKSVIFLQTIILYCRSYAILYSGCMHLRSMTHKHVPTGY